MKSELSYSEGLRPVVCVRKLNTWDMIVWSDLANDIIFSEGFMTLSRPLLFSLFGSSGHEIGTDI